MKPLVQRIRDDLNGGGQDFVLIYAFNGTGKTRLSMEFKKAWSTKKNAERDTLYFNAFTEDLFTWDNDLENDSERFLRFNQDSRFFSGLKELEMDSRISPFLERYADFYFKIDYEKWEIRFSREVQVQVRGETRNEKIENIKISRGEENIFIWCFFLAIAQLTIDGAEAYKWVKYLYIDDPISSLDDNNAIIVACDLAKLLKQGKDHVKTIVSSHHSLFFNVMSNELKLQAHKQYYLHFQKNEDKSHVHTLQATDETPFFHHVAMLSELQKAVQTDQLYPYHFNTLRGVLEKTAVFFGMNDFSDCVVGIDDEVLYARALNLLSHGAYSLFETRKMGTDTKDLFVKIFTAFTDRYHFTLPDLITDTQQAN
jgi:hypothetical protein